MRPSITTYDVDPARLERGQWFRELGRQVGEGDISASYSADRIGMGNPVRRPFSYRGSSWVCVSITSRSGTIAEAYRLVDHAAFDGTPITYAEKARDAEAARNDPCGFYHGMAVTHRGRTQILAGPPAEFVAGEREQLDLFGGL